MRTSTTVYRFPAQSCLFASCHVSWSASHDQYGRFKALRRDTDALQRDDIVLMYDRATQYANDTSVFFYEHENTMQKIAEGEILPYAQHVPLLHLPAGRNLLEGYENHQYLSHLMTDYQTGFSKTMRKYTAQEYDTSHPLQSTLLYYLSQFPEPLPQYEPPLFAFSRFKFRQHRARQLLHDPSTENWKMSLKFECATASVIHDLLSEHVLSDVVATFDELYDHVVKAPRHHAVVETVSLYLRQWLLAAAQSIVEQQGQQVPVQWMRPLVAQGVLDAVSRERDMLGQLMEAAVVSRGGVVGVGGAELVLF